jgi:hypothetical protein
MTIRFENPPQNRRNTKRDWDAIFTELRANPDQWAIVAEKASPSMANQIKRGAYRSSDPGEFDAVSRSNGDGTVRIYARFIGGQN